MRLACAAIAFILPGAVADGGGIRAHASPRIEFAVTARGGSYDNALIADAALRYVGQWGGNACADARRSGETGSTTAYPTYPSGSSPASPPQRGAHINPADGGDGQCRSFVNCVVWMASGHTQWLGLYPSDYFRAFTHPAGGGQPGAEITAVSDLASGDIVQQGKTANAPNLHTYVIVKRVGGRDFVVVDSNHAFDEYVQEHQVTITLNASVRAFRMGTASSSATILVRATLSTDVRRGLHVFHGQVLVPTVVPSAWGQTQASFTRGGEMCGARPVTRKPTRRHYLLAFIARGTTRDCPYPLGGLLSATFERKRPCPAWMKCNAFRIAGQSYDLDVGGNGSKAIAWRQCGSDYYLFDGSAATLSTLKLFLARLKPLPGHTCHHFTRADTGSPAVR